MTISAFASIRYVRPASFSENVLSLLSHCFYLNNTRITVIDSDQVRLETQKSFWQITVLKVAAYVLLFPLTLFLFAVYLELRRQHHFAIITAHQSVQDSNSHREKDEPSLNSVHRPNREITALHSSDGQAWRETHSIPTSLRFQEPNLHREKGEPSLNSVHRPNREVTLLHSSDGQASHQTSSVPNSLQLGELGTISSRLLSDGSIPLSIRPIVRSSLEKFKCQDSPHTNHREIESGLINALAERARYGHEPTPEEFNKLHSEHLLIQPAYQLSDIEHTSFDSWKIIGNVYSSSVLGVAIKIRSLRLMDHILKLDPTLVNKSALTKPFPVAPPLVAAAGDDNPQFALAAVKLLISKGADVQITTAGAAFRFNALWAAAKKGNLDVVKYLILRRATITIEGCFSTQICRPYKFNLAINTLEQAIEEVIEERWTIQYMKGGGFSKKIPVCSKTAKPLPLFRKGGLPKDLIERVISPFLFG